MPRKNERLADLAIGEDSTDFPIALSSFLTEYSNDEEGYRVSLFEVPTTNGRAGPIQYLKSWANYIPTFDEVAECGPGQYRIVMTYTPKGSETKTSTSTTIAISARYQSPNAPKIPNVPQLPAVQNGNSGGIGDAMSTVVGMQQQNTTLIVGMIQQFMATIGGILEQRERRGANDFGKMQQAMTDMMLTNIDQQQTIVAKLMGDRIGANLAEGEVEEMDEPTGLIGWIKKIFYEYGDELLGAGPMMKNLFKSQVQSNPQFQAIQNDPELYLSAYNEIVQEGPENKGKLDTILGMLGAPDPDKIAEALTLNPTDNQA